MKNKKGFEFSFGWLFAIIVGAAILFLAVYAAVKFVESGRSTIAAQSAKQLEVILTPIETGFEEGKIVAPIVFPSETRVYNNCTLKGVFGQQMISTAVSSTIGQRWGAPGVQIAINDKYIFSPYVVQGTQINTFSKTFLMPFKIASLIFLWTDKYCFVNAPNDVIDEINSLGLKNINLSDSIAGCEKNSRKVCFYGGSPACNMIVNPNSKTVERNSKTLEYEGALMYGAIFADPEIYDCQAARLGRRASQLAGLYLEKSASIASRGGGCSSNLQGELMNYGIVTAGLNNSEGLGEIAFLADDLGSRNNELICKLWEEKS